MPNVACIGTAPAPPSASRQRARSATADGTARNTAAMLIRVRTAAARDQPASISDLASAPDVLKAADEKIATARPARGSGPCRIGPPGEHVSWAQKRYSDDARSRVVRSQGDFCS